MLTLTATQAAIVAADNKTAKWAFYIYDKNGVGYSFGTSALDQTVVWATGITWDAGITWSTGSLVSSGIMLSNFSGIGLQRNLAENTVIAPSEVTFDISNSGNILDFLDFKGGNVLIELWLSNGTQDIKVGGWRFRINTAQPGYQNLKITAQDFLQDYLQGDYPNTRLPEDVFPSNRTYSNKALCVPVPFGTAYVPLRDVFITSAGYIMLGSPAYTYAITKIRSPRERGAKCEWSSASYAFNQSTVADVNGAYWRVFQAIIADVDNDGTAESPGNWLVPGGPAEDPPVQFTRSDTATMTNPADVIAFVLKDMGIPAAMIDEVGTFAAAHTIFDGWGLTFNGAFWYKQPRETVIASLLSQCHSCLQVGEKIELRVLVKASQKTITGAEVLRTSEQGEGSFSYQDIVNNDLSDSGYAAYQKAGESQDEFVKVLVAADAVADVISADVLECPFVQNSEDVQRIGTLHLQRKLLKEATAGFLAKGTCLALQPDDRITLNDDNYGGNYVVLIDSVQINKDLSIQFQCSKYSTGFDDWADISPNNLTIPTDTVTPSSSWQPVFSGPDGLPTTGVLSNSIKGRLRVGDTSNYIVIDPSNPLRISVYTSDVETARMGNLNGFAGYTTNVYGMAILAPGLIGGWKIQPTLLQSAIAGAARIELDQANARISIKDATNASKTVMGYLNGLAKNDGTGNWGAGDYGFWAAAGDNLKIDGDVRYKSGDWIVENDGSYLIQNAAAQTIVRLGTVSGVKGLFLYDSATPTQNLLAKFTTAEAFIGEATKYLKYTIAGGLEIAGNITGDGLILSAAGSIKGGQTAYNTGTGFFLGYSTGAYKFSIGNPASEFLTWDGTHLVMQGSLTFVGSTLPWSDISDDGGRPADYADVTLSAINGGLSITGGGITLSAGGAIKGGQTDYATGTGFFLGYSGVAYKFSIGNTTNYLTWNGTTLAIAGEINTTSGYFTGVTLGKAGVTSGTLTLQLNAGGGDTYIAAGKSDFTNADAGFILGLDDSDGDKAKFYVGDSSSYLSWDGSNLRIAGVNFSSTATAAGTTTLVFESRYIQLFTGTTTQTVVLPVATTLPAGWSTIINNQSTGIVTVKTSGGNTIQAMVGVPSSAYNSVLTLTCINPSGGTGTASWIWEYRATGTFTLTGTGFSGAAPTCAVYFTLNNGHVSLQVGGVSGTSNSTSLTLTGLPTILQPTHLSYLPIATLVDNATGIYSSGGIFCYLWNTAAITFGMGGSTGGFTASGTKTVSTCTLTYSLL